MGETLFPMARNDLKCLSSLDLENGSAEAKGLFTLRGTHFSPREEFLRALIRIHYTRKKARTVTIMHTGKER